MDISNNLLARRFYSKLKDRLRNDVYYMECTIEHSWKLFDNFREWAINQKGFYESGWELDKDLLIKGNKLYSEDTCCFVPHEVNVALTTSKAKRGKFPIGVKSARVGKYTAQIGGTKSKRYLGTFSTAEDAFYAYKVAKEEYLKSLADKYKHLLDPRAYEALYAYEVEITD